MTESDVSASPTRVVLEGVPGVGFFGSKRTRAPEDHSFPSCLRAYLEYTGDDFDKERLSKSDIDDGWDDDWHDVHNYLMGTSGMSFWLSWNPRKWEEDKGAAWNIFNMAPDPLAPMQHAFESIGYQHETILRSEHARKLGLKEAGCDDEAVFRQRIIESIRKGRPVIGFGVIGPPERAEACLITGYDDGGDVLIGWSFWDNRPPFNSGVEFEPSGYFRKRNWFRDTLGITLVGDKQPRPPLREVYRKALEWGLKVMRTPEVRGRANGHAAFQAWIEDLQRDEDFTGLEANILHSRHEVHDDTAGYLAEARAWGRPFLRQAAAVEPAWTDDLQVADSCFGTQHDLVYAIWEFTKGENGDQMFARNWPNRHMIVTLIRLAKEEDEQAAEHIDRALAK